jgi:AraC-like DNA-binding protein
MAAKTPGDDLVLFCVRVAGQSHLGQHDRFAELTAGIRRVVRGAQRVGAALIERQPESDLAFLADPCLRAEELARRHHVSVRHAQTLFERIGTTPGAYPREQRLFAARATLTDPRHARLGTSEVAVNAGFVNLRTFERAFRRQYGMTPSGGRREHLHPGHAPATELPKTPPG